MKTGKVPARPSDKGEKGLRPNVLQRRPNPTKHSPAVKHRLNRSQGK